MIMSARIRGSRRGFTLVELLISMAVFSAVLTAIYTVVIWSQQTFTSGNRRQENQQTARLAMAQMVRHIRMTGYISENFDSSTTNDIPASGSTIIVPRIFLASSTALALFGNLDSSTSGSKVFLYCLYGTGTSKQLLFKTGSADVASSYTCSGSAGDVLADNVTSLSFTYYSLDSSSPKNLTQLSFASNGYLDGTVISPFSTGTASTTITKAANALSFPADSTSTSAANRQAVRVIRIQLTVSQGSPMQKQEYTLNSTVELRNNTDS